MSTSQATCSLVYLSTCQPYYHVYFTSNSFTCLLVNHITMSTSQATCSLVYLSTCQLVNHITMSTSQATRSLVYLKRNSKTVFTSWLSLRGGRLS